MLLSTKAASSPPRYQLTHRLAVHLALQNIWEVKFTWLEAWGLLRHAIQSNRTPKTVYRTEANWCVSWRENMPGSTKPRAVEMTCTMPATFAKEGMLRIQQGMEACMEPCEEPRQSQDRKRHEI